MGENSHIQWTDSTFNPWWGCTPVSAACDFCYAELLSKRFGHDLWGNKPRMRTGASNWHQPVKWDKKAAAAGVRHKVFCASMADVFDNQVPEVWRADLWALIRATPNLDWQLLTKRPQNIKKMLPADWGEGYSNVWLGMTAESQEELAKRIGHLLRVPARVRFLSCEPLLGKIYLRHIDCDGNGDKEYCQIDCLTGRHTDMARPCADVPKIHWVICGGESGAHARPMHPDWARGLRDQCQDAGVAFHFKQHGEWVGNAFLGSDTDKMYIFENYNRTKQAVYKVGKKAAGRELDGRTWDEFPKVAA